MIISKIKARYIKDSNFTQKSFIYFVIVILKKNEHENEIGNKNAKASLIYLFHMTHVIFRDKDFDKLFFYVGFLFFELLMLWLASFTLTWIISSF